MRWRPRQQHQMNLRIHQQVQTKNLHSHQTHLSVRVFCFTLFYAIMIDKLLFNDGCFYAMLFFFFIVSISANEFEH